MHKLENPIRVAELNPLLTLKTLRLKKDGVFCDIGAGTGLFSFAADQITSGAIYAVDISSDMRNILDDRNTKGRLTVLDRIEKVPNKVCDLVLLCTVLHEIKNPDGMIREIKRILSSDGRLAIIEFHKAVTSMGPPITNRISEDETKRLFENSGFTICERFALGDNFYCVAFK